MKSFILFLRFINRFFAILMSVIFKFFRPILSQLIARTACESSGLPALPYKSYILGIVTFCILVSVQAKYYPIPFMLNDKEVPNRFKCANIILNLTGPWVSESGLIRNVPFWETEKEHLLLRKHFTVQDTFQNMCIYFEGLAWTSDIYLNGRLLLIHNKPFEPVIIPIENHWLSPVQNELVVHMTSAGIDTDWKHMHALGIHRPVWILADCSLLNQAEKKPPMNTPDSFIVYSPVSSGFLYHIPQERLIRDIRILSTQKVRDVYFSVTPDWEVLNAFHKAGFNRIYTVPYHGIAIWFNAWPTVKTQYLNANIFWFNNRSYPTDAFNTWRSVQDLYTCTRKHDNFVILLILMFPLLGLLILKLSHSQLFNAIPQWILRDRLENELISDRKFLRSGQNALMTLNHLLIMAGSIAFIIYFLQVKCLDTTYFTFNGGESLFNHFLFAGFHPVVQFIIVFSALLMMLMIKLLFLKFISLVFRKHFMTGVYLDLQILAGFPMNMILLAFSVYVFYSFDIQFFILFNIWIGIMIALCLRHIWLLFKGMYHMYHFHPLLIFLYICAFEILPWLIVLNN